MIGFILQPVVALIGLAVRLAYLLGQLIGLVVVALRRQRAGATARRRRDARDSGPAGGRNYVPRPLSSHRLPRR